MNPLRGCIDLGLTGLLVAIGLQLATTHTNAQTNSTSQTAYIEQLKGKIELKRKTSSRFWPITKPGIPLYEGDQLRRANDATVIVACPNGKKQPVRRAEERTGLSEICPQWKVITAKGPPPLGSIAGIDSKTPYLISPRRTLLLTSTPTLRWNPVPGATHYIVKLIGVNGMVWQTQVKEPQITYPGSPPLQPGTPYSIAIETNTGQASQTGSGRGSALIILHPAEAKVVQAEATAIRQSNLSPAVTALKLADYYSNYQVTQPSAYGLSESTAKEYRLNADAIAILETVTTNNQHSPLLYRSLGNLYWQIGLMRPAEAAYLKAIEHVQSLDDLEEWALAMVGLGELYEATQQPQQAILWYSQAKTGFTLLGDRQAQALNRRIERLKEASP